MRRLRWLMIWHGLAWVCERHGFVAGCYYSVCGAEAAIAAGYLPG